MLTKSEEKKILAKIFSGIQKDYPNTYLADIFCSRLFCEIANMIDTDITYLTFEVLRKDIEEKTVELQALNKAIDERQKYAFGVEDRVVKASRDLKEATRKLRELMESLQWAQKEGK